MRGEKNRENDPGFLIGIFFLSAATLLFEVTLSRVFSISQWSHFAFMVVSIALLGFGASGSMLMAFPALGLRDLSGRLFSSSLLFSISSLLSVLASTWIPFDLARIAWDTAQLFYIGVYYLLFAFPFFFSGLTLSSALSAFLAQASSIYFSDLSGASVGAVLPLLLFPYLGAEGIILLSSLLGLLSSFFFAGRVKKRRRLLFPFVGVLLFLFFARPSFLSIPISPYKGLMVALRFPDARIVDTLWNSFSRVDVIESQGIRFAPGLSLTFLDPLPPQIGVSTDGDNVQALTRFTGEREEIRFVSFLPSSLPYYLKKGGDVLILDAGGGLDILSALYHGATSIEAVVRNPLLAFLLTGRYADFVGFSHSPHVRIEGGEGRSYLARDGKTYDSIHLSPLDTFGAGGTGIYSLTEDYQFTVEGMMEYYTHLKPGGYLTVTRYLLPPPRLEIRTLSVMREALERMKISHPERQIAVIQSWGTVTLLTKAGELTEEEITQVKEFCRMRRFDLIYYPGILPEETNIYNRFPEPLYFDLVTRLMDDNRREALFAEYPFDIRPVTDDRPFFFHLFRWETLGIVYRSVGEKWQFFIEGGYLVPVILIQALSLSLVFIVFPLLLSRSLRSPPSRTPTHPGSLFYFLFIGIGFMFNEISLIQRFALFLDHPAISFSLVLFSILLTAGLGSLVSGRITNDLSLLRGLIPVAVLLLIVSPLFLPPILHYFIGKGIMIRGIVTFVSIAPLCFLLGMPFPVGIRILEERNQAMIPWAFCVNGCASVTSAVGAMVLAMGCGFTTVTLLSALAYLLALLSIVWSMGRRLPFLFHLSHHGDKGDTGNMPDIKLP